MADPKKGPGHLEACVPEGACTAACPVGNASGREATLKARIATALQSAAGMTVHTDAKAHGVPATVLVLPDGSAYRLDVFELQAPASKGAAAPPAVELNIESGGAVTVKGSRS